MAARPLASGRCPLTRGGPISTGARRVRFRPALTLVCLWADARANFLPRLVSKASDSHAFRDRALPERTKGVPEGAGWYHLGFASPNHSKAESG
jgi:hypothetical protein